MEGLELGVVTEPSDALRVAVGGLAERVEAVTGHAPLSEHKRMVLARPTWEATTGSGPADRADDADDADEPLHAFGITASLSDRSGPVGYAQVSGDRHRREYAVELLIDPDIDVSAAVVDALVGRCTEEVAARGGGSVRLWRPRATGADEALAGRHGFRRERDLLQMRCPLPLLEPAPPLAGPGATALVTRPFRPGEDEAAWLVTNNRAFATHPEQGRWDLGTLLEREHESWFDPSGFLVLEVDGRMAGSCWTKVHRDATPPMGEIYVISVDPDFHGRGWGRGLTRAGLDWLADQGLSVGMLYVDGDNRAAVHLYRSMGFTEDHVDRSYLRTVG
jgi:mycothiol synthase